MTFSACGTFVSATRRTSGADDVEHVAHEPDDRVRAGLVDRLGARLLPHEPHGVEPDEVRVAADVGEQHAQRLEQHARLAVVEVELVGPERRPQVDLVAVGPLERREQRRRARAAHVRQVVARRAGSMK